MKFNKWLMTLIEEKGLDLETSIEVNHNGTVHMMTLGVVVEGCLATTAEEQAQIKKILVQIDFKNGDVMHFFKHLAAGMAANLAA